METKGMNYPKFQQDLNIALESEILGELIFLNAAQHARSIEQQQKWKTLAQLETQTLQRLEGFLAQQGTKSFMETFERMHQHADATTQEFLQYLFAHEQALAKFATQELKGNSTNSLAAVEKLLKS